MILYNAIDIKVGDEQVLEVRAGTKLVWTAPADIWTFDIPLATTEISLLPNFIGSAQIGWGDGDTDILTNGVSINHIYDPLLWS